MCNMNIREALEKLALFIDKAAETSCFDYEELETIEEVENAIHTYVCEKGDL